MRLIDADDLINVLVADCCADQTKELPVWIEQRIEEQPDIVRCKDCKHGYLYPCGVFCAKAFVRELGESLEAYKDPYWYCADGERFE